MKLLTKLMIAGGAISAPGTPAFTITLDNLVGLTGGGTTNVFMTGSTGGGGVITLKASASRLTGVAPLYINFDATATTSTASTNPSHELFFAWDFGDPGAGTWANGVQSPGLTNKNTAYGPVVGHVFETPGTYVVTPVAIDGDPAHTASRTKTIVVQDPNAVYNPTYGAGYETICISHSGNFTGAPGVSGLPGVATYINTAGNTDMYAAWNTHKASNKRILFCKADTWTASATISATGLANMIVGGYGTGVAHKFASGTLCSVTPALGIGGVFNGGGATDIRFCEFRINADATVAAACGSTGATGTQITFCRVDVRGATCAFLMPPNLGLNSLFKQEQLCIYECVHDEAYGYSNMNPPMFTGVTASNGGGVTPCVFTATGHQFKRFNTVRLVGTPPTGFTAGVNYYVSGTNLTANTFSLSSGFNTDTPIASSSTATCDVAAQGLSGGTGGFVAMTNGGIMGSYLDNCNHGEQTLRVPYFNSSHITNNYIARPNQTKNIVKVHSRGYANIIGVSSGRSEKLVVSGNYLDCFGGYSLNSVIPNNGATATAVGDCSMTIGYGNSSEGPDERVSNIIVENNFTRTSSGDPADLVSFTAVSCPYYTVRNNILDASFGPDRGASYTGSYAYTEIHFVTVGSSTVEQTVQAKIYNNTLYSNLYNAASASFASIGKAIAGKPEVGDVTIKNNLWYMPNIGTSIKGAYSLQLDAAPVSITATHNTDSVSGGSATTSPNFVATPPVLLADWRPNTGSYAIDAGSTVPVLRDFNNASRYGATYDLGAVLP